MPARSPTPSRPDGGRCGRMTRCGYSPRPTAERAPSTRSRPPFPARSGTRPVSSPARTGGRLPASGSNCPGTSPWSNWPRCAGCRSWMRRTRSARQPTDSARSSATPSPPAPGRWSSASAAPPPPTADPARCVPSDWCCGMPTAPRSPAAAGSWPGWHPWIAGACCRPRPAESPCSPTSARRSPARTEPPRCSDRRRVPHRRRSPCWTRPWGTSHRCSAATRTARAWERRADAATASPPAGAPRWSRAPRTSPD